MSFENYVKENFEQTYKYLTLKNKILLFFDKRKYDIMFEINFNMRRFHFIDDEHYIEEMKIDYENYLFFTENKFPFEDSEKYNYCRKKKDIYENFAYTDKRVPDKFKPFIYRTESSSFIEQKLPASVSMKKDIINAVFLLERNIFHPIKINYKPKYRGMEKPDFYISYMNNDEIKFLYESIIDNKITKF